MSRSTSRLQVVGVVAGLIAAGLFAVEPLGAQTVPPPDNVGPIVGLYTTQTIGDDTANHVELPTVPSSFDVWVVLSHSDSEYIRGAEFRVERSAGPGADIMVVGLDSGNPMNNLSSFPDVMIHFDAGSRPVVNGHAWLLRITYVALLPALDIDFFLTPAIWESIPGEMAFLDDSDPADIKIMRPNSEGQLHTNPVFSLTTGTVSTEAHSLSAIKALFR
jgi:hypothetical protein